MQRDRFIALLDALPEQLVLADPDGTVRYANRAVASYLQSVTGLSGPQLIGLHPAQIDLPVAVANEIRAEGDEVNATRTSVTREVAFPIEDSSRWIERTTTPLIENGRIVAHLVQSRDIDERKRATRRLELLSKVSAIVGCIDLEKVLAAVARLAVPELADLSIVDVRHDSIMDRVYIGTRDPTHEELAATLRRIEPIRPAAEASALAAGRSVLYAEASDDDLRAHTTNDEQLALLRRLRLRSWISVPLRIEGSVDAVMTFATTEESGRRYGADDVTLAEEIARRAAAIIENARLHEALKASEARFRVALGVSRTAVFEQDRDLRYRWHHNPMFQHDPVGKRAADLFLPNEAKQLDAVKRRAMETGRQTSDEVRITVGGEPSYFVVTAEPTRDRDGNITGVIGSATDITENKRARDELESALSFRDQVMGMLAHDLRNPLSAILFGASLVRREPHLSQGSVQSIDRIERAAKRMDEMIRTLLDFAQLRFQGAIPIARVPTNAGDVARAIVDELRAARPGRVIEFEQRGDARGEWDPARLAEVLSNLVGNALTHGAQDRPVRVTVDGTGEELSLRVHNEGPVIDPATRDGLFLPFRRGLNPPSATRGVGLGLYIVHELVAAHGGSITVESKVGDGTTFVVRLPRRRDSRAA